MDIKALAEEYGVKNLRIFIEMHPLEWAGFIPGIAFKSSNSPTQMVECVIDESRYTVDDNYKIQCRALDESYGYETYYQSDFNSLVVDCPDKFKVYVLTIDGYTQLA